MPKGKKQKSAEQSLEETNSLLRKLLIVQLAQARASQHTIREIVGCEMSLVTSTLKPLDKAKKG